MPNWRGVGTVGKDVLFGVAGAELDRVIREYLSRRHGFSSSDRLAAVQFVTTRLSSSARQNLSSAVQERKDWTRNGRFSARSLDELLDLVTGLAAQASGHDAEADQAVETLEGLLADDQLLEQAVLFCKRESGLDKIAALGSVYLPRAKEAVQEVTTGIVQAAKKADQALNDYFDGPNRPTIVRRKGLFGRLWNWKMDQLYNAHHNSDQ